LLEKIHATPSDWVVPAKKGNVAPAEPDFKDVDNPGNWNEFIFRPVYLKSGTGKDAQYKYLRHELPAGASPVPLNADGKRVENGWEFFYGGWENSRASVRSGASVENLFPKERDSSLDVQILKSLGLTTDRVRNEQGNPDALFFFSTPVANLQSQTIGNNERQ
jgi:hypothetical protein